MSIQDRAFSAAMMAAETLADVSLFIDFCLFTSVMAIAAPLSIIASLPDAKRSVKGSVIDEAQSGRAQHRLRLVRKQGEIS